jgi:hypothetical protein
MYALTSEAVGCLTLTHECMPPAVQQEFTTLGDLIKPDSDYRAYKRALSKNESNGCIPWHGAYSWINLKSSNMTTPILLVVDLHDMNGIMQGEENYKQQGNLPPSINLQKWVHLKDRAVSTLRYRDAPYIYDGQNLGVAMDYLKKGLESVSAKEEISTRLQANSAELKRNEDKLRRIFRTEHDAGFGRPW